MTSVPTVHTNNRPGNGSQNAFNADPVNIPEEVLKEFDRVRCLGYANMVDEKSVKRIAETIGCTELAYFLQHDIGVNTTYQQLLERFSVWKLNETPS
jgi:hypothetical protein